MINLIIFLGLCLGTQNVIGDGNQSRIDGVTSISFVSKCQSVTSTPASNYQCAVSSPIKMCSGSLVRADSIVTSAYCVNGIPPSQFQIRVGSLQYFQGGIETVVEKVNMHPKYNSTTNDFNVAVLTIPSLGPAQMASFNIAVIPLATTVLPYNTQATLIGYGGIGTVNALPDYMQLITLTKFTSTICGKLWKTSFLEPEMICAGDPQGIKDACTADDGGALVNKGIQYGIYSHGGKCATTIPTAPIFVNVASIINWVMYILSNFSA